MDDLSLRVNEALNTAVFENQYVELLYMNPEAVAQDITLYASDLEDELSEDIIPFIREWITLHQRTVSHCK